MKLRDNIICLGDQYKLRKSDIIRQSDKERENFLVPQSNDGVRKNSCKYIYTHTNIQYDKNKNVNDNVNREGEKKKIKKRGLSGSGV